MRIGARTPRTGPLILARALTLVACTEGGAPGRPTEAPTAAPVRTGPRAPEGLIAFSADVDGRWDFEDGNADIYVLDPDRPGTKPANLTRHPANDYSPEWSPDGKRIAFRTNRDSNHEIYVMNADGSNPVNLTRNPAEERSPAWSPDGKSIAFASNRVGDFDLYVMSADGSDVRRLSVPGGDEYPTWSPDGEQIAFTNACASCSAFSLFLVDADGHDVRSMGFGAGWPDWSPDGALLAYDTGGPGRGPEIHIVEPARGAKPRAVVPGVQADWSPDSRRLVYSRPPGDFSPENLDADLFVAAEDGTQRRRLTRTPGVFEFEPTFQPTGTSPFISLDPEVMDAKYRKGLRRFTYASEAPLRVRTEGEVLNEDGLRRFDLSYRSPRGGRVPATLVVPPGEGRRGAVIVQHGAPGRRSDMVPLARRVAGMGAVVLLINAPHARHGLQLGEPITFTRRDAADQEQLIVDLRRAVDLLVSRRDVNPGRIGYIGVSYGGAMGGLLAGVEHRISAFALVVGDGGLVTHASGLDDAGSKFWTLPRQRRERWVAAMEPIEPLYFIRKAAPSALLLQFGLRDELVPPVDAVVYQEAASEPKDVRWYDSGHGLTPEAECETLAWIAAQLSLLTKQGEGC